MGIFNLFKPNVEKLRDIKDVVALINCLNNKSREVQSRAVDALVQIGEPSVQPLIRSLKYKNEYFRKLVIDTLINIGNPAINSLIEGLRDEDSLLRLSSAEVLDKIGWKPEDDMQRAYYYLAKQDWVELLICGEHAVGPLIQILKNLNNFDEKIHVPALKILSEIGKPGIEGLINLLGSEKENIRTEAAEALGRIGTHAVETLITALKNEHPSVRERVVRILGEIGDSRAVEPLITALNDHDKWTRSATVEALAKFQDDRAVEPLIKALDDKCKYVVEGAARALRIIGDKRAVDPLIIKLHNYPKWYHDPLKWHFESKEELIYMKIFVAIESLFNDKKIYDARLDAEIQFEIFKINDLFPSTISIIETLQEMNDPRAVNPIIEALVREVGLRQMHAAEIITEIIIKEIDNRINLTTKKFISNPSLLQEISYSAPILLTPKSAHEDTVLSEIFGDRRTIYQSIIAYHAHPLKLTVSSCSEALAAIGKPSLEPIMELLDKKTDFLGKRCSNFWYVRQEFAKALGKIGDPIAAYSGPSRPVIPEQVDH